MGKKNKKCISNRVEVWTVEQYEDYLSELYDMNYIAGFTENGEPYGIFSNGEENCQIDKLGIFSDIFDDLD